MEFPAWCFPLLCFFVSLLSAEQAVFENFGFMTHGLGTAHLVTTINLTKIRDAQETLTADIHALNTSLHFRLMNMESRALVSLYTNRTLEFLSLEVRRINTYIDLFSLPAQRQKRQLEFLLPGLALGTSIYTIWELEELKARVAQDEQTSRHVLSMVEENHHAIYENTANIERLHTDVSAIFKHQHLQDERAMVRGVFAEVKSRVRQHVATLRGWGEALTQLFVNRLDPGLIKLPELQQALDELLRQARKKGFHLVFQRMADLFKLEVSYLVKNDILTVFLHVPMAEQEPLKLLRLVDAPLSMKDGLTTTLQQEKRILALDVRHNAGIELRDVDLLKCVQLRNQYSCPNTNLLTTRLETLCLGTLFLNHKDASSRCPLQVNRLKEEQAVQVASDKVLFFIPTTARLTRHCRHSETKIELLSPGINVITVPEDCHIATTTFTFRPEVKLNVSVDNFILIPIDDPLKTISADVVKDYFSESNRTATALTHAHHLQQEADQRPSLHPTTHRWIHSTILVVTGSLTFALIGYFAFYRCCYGRMVSKQKKASAANGTKADNK